MKYKVIIGVDVSKKSLDFHVLVEGETSFHLQVSNDAKGIKQLFTRLNKQVSLPGNQWLVCMEPTGIYCYPLLNYIAGHELALWLENASLIKAYHGLEREKSDAIDARRIAEYAWAKQSKIRRWKAPRAIIIQLKNLLSLRKRLLNGKNRLAKPMKEDRSFQSKEWNKAHQQFIAPMLVNFEKKIKAVEKQIKQLIKEDAQLKKYFQLITSVRGVGLIVATHLITVSNEFRDFNDPKKMACHCGVVPFNRRSGTSLNTKPKLSHRANKQLKSLLHMAAMSAIKAKGELRDYYLRKVEGEGKNKMTVLNAVRNKIILRVFACIRDNREYQNSYMTNLV